MQQTKHVPIFIPDTPGASVRYTRNGQAPTLTSGEPYAGPFAMYADECLGGCRVTSRGFKPGWLASDVRVLHLTVAPVAPDPILTPPGGSFVGEVNVVLDVDLVSGGGGSGAGVTVVRWTTDPDAEFGSGLVDVHGNARDEWRGGCVAPGALVRVALPLGAAGGGARAVQLRCQAVRAGAAPSAVVDALFTLQVRN
jgi:hypothetical protein